MKNTIDQLRNKVYTILNLVGFMNPKDLNNFVGEAVALNDEKRNSFLQASISSSIAAVPEISDLLNQLRNAPIASLDDKDIDFIVTSLNAMWNESDEMLSRRKDLGDIRVKNLKENKSRCREIMVKLGVI